MFIIIQLVWIGIDAPSSENCINYDPDFDNVSSYWNNSTWNPSPNPADHWMKTENGTVTLYYKGNRTDWGNTEVCQGKKPAFEVTKPLRYENFSYGEGSNSLTLYARVRRDIDPIWQGSSLSEKSRYPQANIGVYMWFEVKGWNYDDWNTKSSLVIDIYFDSRHQGSNNETIVSPVGESYDPTSTPYDKQIHAGYVVGVLPLNSWQSFDIDISNYVDQTMNKCRTLGIGLPSDELVLKFFGVYVDTFSAAVQASFDYVRLENSNTEDSNSGNLGNVLIITITSVAIITASIIAYSYKRRRKQRAPNANENTRKS